MATLTEALLIALDHHRSGRLFEAETLYRRILEVEPEQPDALQLLGVLIAGASRLSEASAMLRRSVAVRPGAAAYSNLGGVLQMAARPTEAAVAYGRALLLDPGLADAHASRAAVLRSLGQADVAADSAARALMLDPAHADALVNRADALSGLGKAAEAEAMARRAARVRDSAAAQLTLGSALALLDRLEEAEAALRSALSRRPDYAEAWENLGTVLTKQHRFGEALSAFSEAEALRPGPSLWMARGTALVAMARPVEALTDFDRALPTRPNDAGLHWNLGFTRLMAGDLAGGWSEFEWRRRDRNAKPPWRDFPQPTWRGEDIAGRTILLYAEQGFGDTLQFLRYVPQVVARGARVILEVQPLLGCLMAGVEGVEKVIALGDPLPPFDVECPLMSLPRAFGTVLETIPAEVPYLRPDPERVERWRDRLVGPEGLRVGLVWAGNPNFKHDRLRSPRLSGLRRVLDVPGVRFFGLQKGPGRADLTGSDLPAAFTDLGPEIRDFADTAAIMAGLDLVISSCTGPAHLAGALGVPLWIALPFSPDWRWMLGRDDSPWYPSARLFRQHRPGRWDDVAERMALALQEMAARPSFSA